MLLTITTTHQPATDLGFLLHKNPGCLHTISLNFGAAHVFYPEATEQRCTAALLLDIDPVGLVRKDRGGSTFTLAHYINDRPYVASSFLSVALNKAFRTLLSGQSRERPELVAAALPLEVTVHALPCRGGTELLERLFAPLGYEIDVQGHPLDEHFPDWGESTCYTVTLRRTCPLKEFLSHLYVLIPVLDHEKHYFISKEEIGKLLRFGEGWLQTHPERELITHRYLIFPGIANEALVRLSEGDPAVAGEPEERDDAADAAEEPAEAKTTLNQQRLHAVAQLLKEHGARRVIDLGC